MLTAVLPTGRIAVVAGPSQQQAMRPGLELRLGQHLLAFQEVLALDSEQATDAFLDLADRTPTLRRPAARVCTGCGGTVWSMGRHHCHPDAALPSQLAADEVDEVVLDVLSDVVRELGPDGRHLAETVLGLVTRRGHLVVPAAEVCLVAGVDPRILERVLALLRAGLGAGFAASGVRESLLLQLAARPDAPHGCLPIVERHLDALSDGRVPDIEGCDVPRALAWMRDHLDPGRDVIGGRWVPPSPPDVVVHLETGRPTASPGDAPWHGARADDSTAREAVDRFASRQRTLVRLVQLAVDHQAVYVDGGPLVALTQVELAGLAGLSASTVSRAIEGTAISLPLQGIQPFRDLLRTPGDVVREALAELLGEQQGTDLELSALLAEQGHRVARRTVAKYRQQLRG